MSAMRLHLPGHEPRPHVERDLSNWDQVTEHYTDHGPNVGFQKFFFWTMDKLLDTNVVLAPGAREEIEEHMASGDPTILAMSHHSFFDPSNDSAALYQERELFEPLIGNFIVPARLDYFEIPVIGSVIAVGGAKPTARRKDMESYFRSQGMSPEEVAAKLDATGDERKEVNRMMQQVMVAMALEGKIYASYIEGERNRGDQSQLQPPKDGIKKLLEAMDNPEDAKIICIGHDYEGRLTKYHRMLKRYLTPTLYIDIVSAPSDPEDVNGVLQETLQGCLDGAIEHRRQRNDAPLSPLGKTLSLAAVAGAAVAADKLMARRG